MQQAVAVANGVKIALDPERLGSEWFEAIASTDIEADALDWAANSQRAHLRMRQKFGR